MWDGQRLEETGRSLVRGLVLGTNLAGFNEVPSVLLQSGPPEPLPKNLLSAKGSRVTGQIRGVGPLQNFRPKGVRNEETVRRTRTRTSLILGGSLDSFLDVPGEGSDDTGGSQNGGRFLWVVIVSEVLTRKGVRFGVAGARSIGQGEVKP